MGNPIRVLHVLGGTGLGGAESRIMDLYRQMNREEIQFDFLVHSGAVHRAGDDENARKPQFYDEEIRKMGGRIYVLPKFKVYNYFTYRKAVKAFFTKHHEFRVVQGHMTSTASIYLPLAKRAGVPITVAHSRNAGVEKGLKGMATRFFRRGLCQKADYCFACSEAAGVDVFGAKWMERGEVRIIHNAIDTARFAYQPQKSAAMRRKLGAEDKLIVGHVGRFDAQTNHSYLIEIFAALCRKREDAVLFLLGEGAGRAKIEKQCEALGIRDKVFFEGNQKQPENYYQAFDVFLLPSFYEGLPGVLVEAQAAGLPCFVSDTVTREAQATGLVTYLSIQQPPEKWAQAVLSVKRERKDTSGEVAARGFDVRNQAAAYRSFYLNGDVSGL